MLGCEPQPGDNEETDAAVKRPAAADYCFDARGSTGDYEEGHEHELAARHLVMFAVAAVRDVAALSWWSRRIFIVI